MCIAVCIARQAIFRSHFSMASIIQHRIRRGISGLSASRNGAVEFIRNDFTIVRDSLGIGERSAENLPQLGHG